jgi:alpha-D-ribose 1-methylphosphonate 5-triphosphate synthase subunit PhnI
MYVAVKGGERAIDNAHELLAQKRRGDPAVPELTLAQISQQLALAVDRVMAEGSLYDRELAALAVKQARGDLVEAIFLVRAYRTTLPRFGASEPIDTGAMEIRRRISAAFKDLPGGQVLGPTFDYTHRLLDTELGEASPSPSPRRGEGRGEGVTALSIGREPPHPDSARKRAESDLSPPGRGEQAARPAPLSAANDVAAAATGGATMPRVTDILGDDGLIEPCPPGDPDAPVGDLTRAPLTFPAGRDLRLQNLARGDEGFLLALGYSTQRGYSRTHPFAGEIRLGEVEVEFMAEEVGFAVPLGAITVTECQMINQFRGSATEPPQFTRGYGLAFGHCERKVMAMTLVDRALRADELGEERKAPAQDEEFVLSHSDNVQATGFVEHLKLPHYVDFQSELVLIRRMRAEIAADGDARREAAE